MELVDAPSGSGRRPLQVSCELERRPAAALLLAHGWREAVDADAGGAAALRAAARRGDHDMVGGELLLLLLLFLLLQ